MFRAMEQGVPGGNNKDGLFVVNPNKIQLAEAGNEIFHKVHLKNFYIMKQSHQFHFFSTDIIFPKLVERTILKIADSSLMGCDKTFVKNDEFFADK